VLADCGVGDGVGYTGQLWLVPIDGSTPQALTAPNHGQTSPDVGDHNAWQLPVATFVQASAGCGSTILTKLNPDGTTTEVPVPNFSGGEWVIGAHDFSLTLQTLSGYQLGCDTGPAQGSALLDHNPATNTWTALLGPTVNGGGVVDAVPYPGQG
jgi:TolB protein